MRTIRMVAGAEMRHRWGSIVVLTLLVGFVGTVVVASAAGARRAASSLERFEQSSRAAEAGKGRYRIVGQVLSVSLDDPAPLADGAAVTVAGMARLGSVDNAVLVVRVAPGVDREDAVRHLRRVGGGYEPVGPSVPSEVERIRQIDAIPVLLAAFVADSLGVAPTPTLPVVALFVVVIAAVLLANLIAWFPARRAARTCPATVLRSE